MDKVARLTLLDSRSANAVTKRIIDQVIKDFISIRSNNLVLNDTLYEERVRAIKNALFLKYTCIEFEAIFQSIYVDKKFER